MNKKRKVAIIGLDGACLDLIEPWVQDGCLPNFKKVLTEGAGGRLRSVMPPWTAQAWTTLYTGKNCGKHGIYDFFLMRPNNYNVAPVSSFDNKAQTFWEIISSSGKKVSIFNTPLTYPVKEVNGILVSGIHTPLQADDFTYPRSIKQELDKVAGGYSIYPSELQGDRDAYLKSLHEVTEKQFESFFHYFKQDNWDLFMCVFQGTDTTQHYFWQFMDNTHPLYQEGNKYKEVIKQFYQKIDTYLGQFIKHLSDETTLIIVSDHGGSAIHKCFHSNTWLYKLGMIKFKQNPKVWFRKICFALNLNPLDIYNFLFTRGSKGKRNKRARYFFSFRDIDWPKTRAFSYSINEQIWINLKGRQPRGCVEPGQEYEQLCREIVRRLRKIRDPETGKAVIEDAYRKDELYSGPFVSSLPDINYIHSHYRDRGGNKFYSNKLFERSSREDISGTHSVDGIGLFYGNGINCNQHIKGLQLQDIAPIVLSILGLSIPEDMDGRVKKEIFHPGFLKETTYSSAIKCQQGERYHYSPEEVKAMEKHLKELGYLD